MLYCTVLYCTVLAVSECHDAVMEEDAPLYSEPDKKESQYHAGAVGVVFVHNLSHDTMSRCSSGVRSVIATTAGNLAMVHTFPDLSVSVLFSGRVHISLDNTSRGRSRSTNNGPQSDHTGAIHPISSIQPCHDTVTQHQGIHNQQIFSGSNEIFSWHHDTG